MAIDLDGLARGIASVKQAGTPILRELRASTALSDEVFAILGPHSYNEVGRTARTLIPQSTIRQVDDTLARMGEHQAAARAGIDDAFGSGTWMSEFVQADEAFTAEARRILADPRLGPDSADTARSMLANNNFAYTEAVDALRFGRVEKLADRGMHDYVRHLDDAARAESVRWREIYG